jgi:hypothetical protein
MTTTTTAVTTTTTTAAAAITRRKIKNKTCDRCGIERRTMYTRHEPHSSLIWAEPYRDLCPNCYLLEEEKKKRGRNSYQEVEAD